MDTDPLAITDTAEAEVINITQTVADLPLELTDIVTPLGIMVDIETLGTGNHASILSIGAVKFSATEILDEFHVGVDPATAEAYGCKIDPATVLWWMSEDRAEARTAWLALEKVDLASALWGFSTWIGNDSLPLWGNGATFDNVILRSAYAATGLHYPIKFYHDRCYRTVKNMAPDVVMVREGTLHDGLADAISQAKHLLAIASKLGVVL